MIKKYWKVNKDVHAATAHPGQAKFEGCLYKKQAGVQAFFKPYIHSNSLGLSCLVAENIVWFFLLV